MSRGLVAFSILAVVTAAVCVRLGIWQLDRRAERRERNAVVASRLGEPAVGLLEVPREPDSARFRRTLVHGVADYDGEFVVASRSRNGAPGVYVLTPVRWEGGAVLVNRGWTYSADGATVDLASLRGPDTLTATGYVIPFEVAGRGPGRLGATRRVRRVDSASVASLVAYPLLPYVIYATRVSGADTTSSARLFAVEPPPSGDGPHLGYAIQWFGFATVALVGTAVVLRRRRGAGDALRG